jgi:putative MFS transporter
MNPTRVLADRRHLWAFVIGCVAVTAGVVMHLPMFWMGRGNGFRLADMPMDAPMRWGMALIVAGIGVSAYGLLPKWSRAGASAPRDVAHELSITASEDAPLGFAHWRLMCVLTVALVIDVMKPASPRFRRSRSCRRSTRSRRPPSPGCRSRRCAARSSARCSGAGSPTSTDGVPRSCFRR